MAAEPVADQHGMFDEPAPRRGEFAVPAGADLSACRSCGAPIIWTRSAKGRPVPLATTTIQTRGGVRYALSHFVDCPQCKDWSTR